MTRLRVFQLGVEPQRAPNGDYFIWLDPPVVNRLAAPPGESYSDVILRLAKGDGEP